MDEDPRGKLHVVRWLTWVVVVLLVAAIFETAVRAQDSPPDQIRCSGGWCLVPQTTLVEMSATLQIVREQLEQYARLCRWVK